MEAPNLIHQSDKFFWHGYIDFYEKFFTKREFKKIAEIGVNRGASIRWLLSRFPQAKIHGADIIPVQPEWPTDSRFNFFQMDQGNKEQVKKFFASRDFDLIIEDGSHKPEHQIIALVEGLKALKKDGIYILEDVHTSHPTSVKRSKKHFKKLQTPKGNALSVLLGIEHYKSLAIPIDLEKAKLVAQNSLISSDEVLFLNENIKSIHLYRRTRLPLYCIKCGSTNYNFSAYKCLCGEKIFKDYDSMSFVIQK